jgi:hypothetical protein
MFEGYAPEVQVTSASAVLTDSPLAFLDRGELQHQDPELQQVIKCLQRGEVIPNYSLSKGVLHCRASLGSGWKIVAPGAMVSMVFNYFHMNPTGGHLDIFKTIQKICQKFMWKDMDRDIRERVKHCQICAVSRPAQTNKFCFLVSQPAERPLQRLFIDYFSCFPCSKSGNTMLLVCVDRFSNFVRLFPVLKATTAVTINAMRKGIFASFSVPEVIVLDNTKCFLSGEFRKFCFSSGIQHITMTPYYPNPSHAESFNRNLHAALTAYHADSQTKWNGTSHGYRWCLIWPPTRRLA